MNYALIRMQAVQAIDRFLCNDQQRVEENCAMVKTYTLYSNGVLKRFTFLLSEFLILSSKLFLSLEFFFMILISSKLILSSEFSTSETYLITK